MTSDLARYRSSLLSAMGVAPALATLALSGCDVDDQSLPGDMLPPPLSLSGGDLLTGTTNVYTVTGALPGQRVFLAGSRTLGAGPCPSPIGPVCLDLASPQLLAIGTADASGVAELEVLVPYRVPDGLTLYVQAAVFSPSPGVSAPLELVADHPTRTCGELPFPTPANAYDFNQYLICMAVPSTGVCEPVGTVDPTLLTRTFYRQTNTPYPAPFGGFDAFATCFEDTVEGACCYGSEVFQFAIGRPFTVAGEARLATSTHEASWAEPIALDLSSLPRRVRRRLAALWSRAAHGEHASIASFARFQLHLMKLGAPHELVMDATTAMADEIRHAREAFGVASAFAGEVRGPGPLDTTDALDDADLHEIVLATVREGCVAETIAAAQVAEAARRCADPTLAALLARTAADEQRHAALAWRFVRWAVAQHPELGDLVAAELDQPYIPAPSAVDPDGEHLAAWGHLPKAEAEELARDVYEQVVRPCGVALRLPVVAAA